MSAQPARGAWLFYVVAAAATGVSINTSWRFFGEVLHIPTANGERALLFAVLELAMVACGVAMRAGVRSTLGKPGPARTVAWALCGMSAYMAIAESGMSEGLARVALGPVLALVTLHLALGVEVRTVHAERSGTLARVGRELRERVLSRLGLGDDSRDAVARTKDRAADRAARLATGQVVMFRRARLARAVRVANVALDVNTRDRMLAQVATYRHLGELRSLDRPSPWTVAERVDAVAEHVQPALADHVHPEDTDASAAVTEPQVTPDSDHGQGRSGNAEIVRRIHAEHPRASHAELARLAGVSPSTVRRYRPDDGPGEQGQPERINGRTSPLVEV
jgi:hypothetical protein